MYISNNPHAPRPTASGYAAVDAADAARTASAEPASSCRLAEQDDSAPPPGPTPQPHEPSSSSSSNPPPSSAAGSAPGGTSASRSTAFPISFSPIFLQRGKTPSASLAPSTAQGKPVRLTESADAHHSSALQKLNSKYPAAVRRHGYAPEAPGAQSSTYSQPVLVRTYSGPPPSQGSRSTRSRQYRPPSTSRGISRRVPLPSASTPGSGGPGRPIQPTVSDVGVGTTSSVSAGATRPSTDLPYDSVVYGISMPRPYKPKKPASNGSKLPLPWPWQSSRQEPEEPKLPPLEAFSFKSFMADLQVRGGDNDIGADLDRIAEICARSRYSLSNQYEVHVAPHGSGASFMSAAGTPSSAHRRKGHSRSRSHGGGGGGPTLQAITSDDENPARSHPQRRNPGKRRNTAYGTLETIMSSSRSSEEDKSKKKSASELVGEVRGRAAKKAWDNSTSAAASASTGNGANTPSTEQPQAQQQQPPNRGGPSSATDLAKLARKKSASFATAIMDSGKSNNNTSTTTTTPSPTGPSSSSSSSRRQPAKKPTPASTQSALLSEPARPQTSTSHLGVRTTPDGRRLDRHHYFHHFQQQQEQQQQQGQQGQYQLRQQQEDAAGDGGGGGGGGVPLPEQQQQCTTADGSANDGGGGSWAGWIPWRMGLGGGGGGGGGGEELAQPMVGGRSHAEGSLRLLLEGCGRGGAG